MESKYLTRFQKLNGELFPLRGNRIIVEVLPKEEIKSEGGLIVTSGQDIRSTTKENQADLAIVLAIGAGYIGDDGEDVAIDLKPGNVVLLSRLSLKYYSQFPGVNEYTGEVLAMTRETEIHAAWDSIEAYEQYRKALNS